MLFFQECWKTITDDLLLPHSKWKDPKRHQCHFFEVNPKKTGDSLIQDYRPISLISGPYKILAKILSHRILEVLHEATAGTQYAFIR